MSCTEDKERLSAWRDGELGEAERAAVSAHLSACAECRAVVEAYEAIGRDLAATPRIPAPPSILERVRRENENVVPFRRPMLMPFAIGAAAALLIAVNIAVFLSVPAREAPTPTAAAPQLRQKQADESVAQDGAFAGGVAAPAPAAPTAPVPVLMLVRVDDKARKAADALTGRLQEYEQRRRADYRDRAPGEAARLEPSFDAGTVYELDLTQQEYDDLKKLAADQGLAVEERATFGNAAFREGGELKKEALARGLTTRSAAPVFDAQAPPPAAPAAGAEKGGGRPEQAGKLVAEENDAAKPKAAVPARFRVRVVLEVRSK